MKCGLEATVDICLKISSIRNLCEEWIGPMYLIVETGTDSTPATPYQILSNKVVRSKISLQSYQSEPITLNGYQDKQIQQLVIFKIHVSAQQLRNTKLLYIRFYIKSLHGQYLSCSTLPQNSILGLNSYVPCFFGGKSCTVDTVVTTHLLSFKMLRKAPSVHRQFYYEALDNLILGYNKLRKRVSHSDLPAELEDEVYINMEKYPSYANIVHFNKHRIFKWDSYLQHVEALQDLSTQFFAQMNVKLQLLWNCFLKETLTDPITEDRKHYFENEAVKKKRQMYLSDRRETTQSPDVTFRVHRKQGSFKADTENSMSSLNYNYQEDTEHHIIVLVHGLGASSKAMVMLQEYLKFVYPKLQIINSTANQSLRQHQISIAAQGRNLSMQIEQYIIKNHTNNFHISFIGYSLGGLVIRAALPHLEAYKHHMRNFITFSTPHLGHLLHNTKIIKLGMKTFNKVQVSLVIQELLMEDHSLYRHCFLYRLTQFSGLNWFEEVVLFGCREDGYVSMQSAHAQWQQSQANEGMQNELWIQMSQNLDMKLQNTALTRMEVSFKHKQSEGVLDWLLGKTSHIAYLNSLQFINTFVICNRRLFI